MRSYINNPAVNRREIIAAIQRLNEPQPGVYIKALKKAYEAFTTNSKVDELLGAGQSIGTETSASNETTGNTTTTGSKSPIRREVLKLICFDYVWQ